MFLCNTCSTEPALFVGHLSSDRVMETGRNSPNHIPLTPEVVEEFKRFISNNDAASMLSLLDEDCNSTDAVEVPANNLVEHNLEQKGGESEINVDVFTVTAFSPTENVMVLLPSPESESSTSATLTPAAKPSESNSSMLSLSASSSTKGMGKKTRIVPPNERHDMFEVSTYPNFSCEYCMDRFIFKPTMLMHQALNCLKNPNLIPNVPACSNKNTEVDCAKSREVLPTPTPIPTPQAKFQEETNNTQPTKSQDRSPKTRRRWTRTRPSNESRMHFKSRGILSLTPILFYVPRIRIGYRNVGFCKCCKTLFGSSVIGNRHKTRCAQVRSENKGPHVCSICRRRCISEYNLKSHQNIEHKDSKRKYITF